MKYNPEQRTAKITPHKCVKSHGSYIAVTATEDIKDGILSNEEFWSREERGG